jgi:hypothetical protein
MCTFHSHGEAETDGAGHDSDGAQEGDTLRSRSPRQDLGMLMTNAATSYHSHGEEETGGAGHDSDGAETIEAVRRRSPPHQDRRVRSRSPPHQDRRVRSRSPPHQDRRMSMTNAATSEQGGHADSESVMHSRSDTPARDPENTVPRSPTSVASFGSHSATRRGSGGRLDTESVIHSRSDTPARDLENTLPNSSRDQMSANGGKRCADQENVVHDESDGIAVERHAKRECRRSLSVCCVNRVVIDLTRNDELPACTPRQSYFDLTSD